MKIDILYICDRECCNKGAKCKSFDCCHTTDVDHSLFYKDSPNLVDLNTFEKIQYSKDIVAYIEPIERLYDSEWIANLIKERKTIND